MNFEKEKKLQKSTLTIPGRRNSIEANSLKSPKVKFFTGYWSRAEINRMCSNGMGSPTNESKFNHTVISCKSDPVRYGENQ